MSAAVIGSTSASAGRKRPNAGLGLLDAMGVIKHLAPHESLSHEGDAADYFYRVLSGTIAAYKAVADGRRQIVAFYFPGDPVGLATDDARYTYSVEAVDRASVCSVPRHRVRELSRQTPVFRESIYSAVRREMAAAQERLLWLGRKTARERLACFLLECDSRVGQTGKDQRRIVPLPMSQQEIGDYLGLASETVSRTLAELAEDGTIEVLRPFTGVIIRDRQSLESTTDEGIRRPGARL